MPALTRWFIKTALLYFIAALLLGLLLAAQALGEMEWVPAGLFPVYFHLLALGWITQLIFGIAFWMFPKASKEKPRGSEMLGWMVYILLNLGLVLRAFAEPLNVYAPGSFWGWALVISALLQWLAGALFAANTWSRVREGAVRKQG
jgi:hypothetical protein